MRFKRSIAATVIATATLMGGTSALASSDTQDSTSNSHNTSILTSSSIQNSASNLAYPSFGNTTVWFNEPSWGSWEIAYACEGGTPGGWTWGELQFLGGSNAQGGSVGWSHYRIRTIKNNSIVQQGKIGQWSTAGGNYFAKYSMPNEPYVVEISPPDNTKQFVNFYHRSE
ncbi:hypothetical protein BK704_33930 [[Bacillus thuringiensis] serovar konkukian]|nr:hypothetical protein [Bacillus thuringiensis]ANN35565.1 hypothetical protein A9498_29675 [Bacillus thuringiensis serovar coreanensis]MED1303838.1 hypothetical protein [Bacillus pacificus]OUA92300.1 hypothetical protein BK704_33930 [[Bacillus thuringiensis] serovar konkukian]